MPTHNGTHFTTPGSVASAGLLIEEVHAIGEIFHADSFELARVDNDVEYR